MSWGAAFNNAYGQASSVAQAAADKAMSSAAAAAEAVGRTALAAASATRDAAVTAGSAAKTAVVAAGSAAKSVASAAAKGVGNVAGFGARAVGEVAVKSASVAADLALAPYKAAKAMFAPVKSPANNIVEPCANSWEGKKARLEKRNQLIQDGSKSPNPDTRRAAERFAANNDAVELAKLSKDSYDQYPGPSFDYPDPGPIPPTGWRVVTKAELVQRGVSVQALEDSRAVVYETASDWPGGKKTVMSFRGTADLEDGLVDYDQAMAVPSEQYAAAMKAGHQMAKAYPGAVVTGHSLGGGKAQAAAARSGMGGTMFNSAGLNPETVSGSMPAADQFKQYRTVGDPLTGVQNSPVLQPSF